MTMIVGLNLSDRVYLAADTRVTDSVSGKSEDCVLKILPIIESPAPGTFCLPENVLMAVAGHVELASFFYKQIHEDLLSKILPANVRDLEAALTDSYVTDLLSKWVEISNEPFNKGCCLLFAGQSARDKKILTKSQYEKLSLLYKKLEDEYLEKRQELIALVDKDPVFQQIDKKMRKEAGKSVLDSLDEGSQLFLPEHIRSALAKNGVSDQRDSHVFSLEISVRQTGIIINRESTEWGELIVKGKSVVKEEIPGDMLAKFEFMPGKEKNKQDMLEGMILATTISDYAKERGIIEIGGPIMIASVKDGMVSLGSPSRPGEGIRFTPHGTFVGSNGKFVPLVPFNNYPSKKIGSQAVL